MQQRLSPHRLGVVLAAGGMLLISLDSLGIRLTEASSWDIAFWYGVFTASAMTVVVPLRSGVSFPSAARANGLPGLISGVLQSGSTLLFILALGMTAVSNVVVMLAASPILAALIARYTIGERTVFRTWMAIAASLAGILIVVSGSFGGGRLQGDLVAAGAVLCFASNLTLWRRFPELNRMVIIGLSGAFTALIAFFPADPGRIGMRAVLILVVLGGITGPLGRIGIASSTRYLPTSQASLFVPVETVAATTWAWLFLNEPPPAATIIGGAIVLAAVAYGAAARTEVDAAFGQP